MTSPAFSPSIPKTRSLLAKLFAVLGLCAGLQANPIAFQDIEIEGTLYPFVIVEFDEDTIHYTLKGQKFSSSLDALPYNLQMAVRDRLGRERSAESWSKFLAPPPPQPKPERVAKYTSFHKKPTPTPSPSLPPPPTTNTANKVASKANPAAKTPAEAVPPPKKAGKTFAEKYGIKPELVKGRPGGVNINTASKATLEKLPGIGKRRSELIMLRRPYTDLEDLANRGNLSKHTIKTLSERIAFE